MKILLTGRNGQVGWELERALPAMGEVVATDRATLDLADLDAVRRKVRELKPDVIVNAAAYTAVDKAETESGMAMRINGEAPGVLAEEASRIGAMLVHYSTDYVFNGEKPTPYLEDDLPDPVNEYGRSKLAGENAIRDSSCQYLILRTSWIYALRGMNFMNTILRLARERTELKVVGDQIGSPTPAGELAIATLKIIDRRSAVSGTFHLTCGGSASWYQFAKEILAHAGMTGISVAEILSAEFHSAARRPRSSVLSNERVRKAFGVSLPDWGDALARVWAGRARDSA